MLTKRTGNPFREYYICFQDSDELPAFWKLFTRKGFEHCHVYMAYDHGTMCVSTNLKNTEVYTWDMPIETMVNYLLKLDCTLVYLPRVLVEQRKNRLGVFAPTCVAMCQQITGLTFHALTPYHYFRKLLKNGGHFIGGNMGGKPKQNKALLAEQQRQLKEAKEREEREKAAQADLLRRQRSGRRSLLGTEGDELGVA